MERYTYFEGGKWRLRVGNTEHSAPWVDRLAAYEDTGLEPEDIEKAFNEEAVLKLAAQALGTTPERLRELVKAQDEGRVVVPPCKVGDTIFVIPSRVNFGLNKISHPGGNRVSAQIVSSVNWYHKSRYLLRTCDDFCSVPSSEYGITWFLSYAEAEAALGGGGDG